MRLTPVAKKSLKALSDALKPQEASTDTGGQTAADFVKLLLAEPDKKKRKKMVKDFSERKSDLAKFLKENEDLINAEAEMALISAAVGGTVTEKEVSYKGGRRTVSSKEKHIAPNVSALGLYLKNKMPDKYSDKPQTEIEIEDLSEIEEEIYENNSSEASHEEDNRI